MPEIAGVEHSYHDLRTRVRVHLAAAGPRDAPAVRAVPDRRAADRPRRALPAEEAPQVVAERNPCG
jgi:hypothetical protein